MWALAQLRHHPQVRPTGAGPVTQQPSQVDYTDLQLVGTFLAAGSFVHPGALPGEWAEDVIGSALALVFPMIG
jgi:hypothetical protein